VNTGIRKRNVCCTITHQLVDSLAVTVPHKKRKKKELKGREKIEMLEKAFTIPTSSAAAVTSTRDKEC
jgi:phosphopantetheine adenylyltransferase